MDFDELKEDLMPVLHKLLAKRLPYNRTWGNVKVIEGKRKMKIVWFEPKNPTDLSKERDVFPFNAETLTHMIAVQFGKLNKDIKNCG